MHLPEANNTQITEVKHFIKNEIAKYTNMLTLIETQEQQLGVVVGDESEGATQRRQLTQLVSNLAYLKDKLYSHNTLNSNKSSSQFQAPSTFSTAQRKNSDKTIPNDTS